MSKVELDPITSGYNLSKINDNFQKIEDELNSNVLYRQDNPGESNHMSTILDMNSNRIINLLDALSPSEPVTLRQLESLESVDAGVLRLELAAGSGSSLVGFLQAGDGAVPRTAQDKMREFVSAKDFGVVANGVADDTLGMIKAFKECRLNNKTLLIEGKVVFNASSVPAGDKHTATGGDYVYASSLTGLNDAELIVNGKIGFDTTGVDHTLVQNFTVTTTGREMGEADANNTSPRLFGSFSGTKKSAIYRDLVINNGVTDQTGAYKVGYLIAEIGCLFYVVDTVKAFNTINTVLGANITNAVIRNVFSYNVETSIYLEGVNYYQISNIHHINTKQNADFWVGRTAASPRGINGMDCVLIGAGNSGIISGLTVEWAHERTTYIQSNNVRIIGCHARNCMGYKIVGTDYSTTRRNGYIDDCHVHIDSNFEFTRGRDVITFLVTYWYRNVHSMGCSIINDLPALNPVQACFEIGLDDGHTVEDVFIKGFKGVNVVRLARAQTTKYTTAQLAALTPPGSFYSLKNLHVEECSIKKSNLRATGCLFDIRTAGASADAQANYAVQNIKLINNTIELATATTDRDDFIFCRQYVDGLISKNTTVDKAFVGGGFFTAPTTQYRNISVVEENLIYDSLPGALLGNLQNLTTLLGSRVKFRNSTGSTSHSVSAHNYADGGLDAGNVACEIAGKGFLSVATTASWAMEMNASGNFYFGKAIAGVKTDQVSTPPIGITVSASSIDIRGDISPTVLWRLKLSKV